MACSMIQSLAASLNSDPPALLLQMLLLLCKWACNSRTAEVPEPARQLDLPEWDSIWGAQAHWRGQGLPAARSSCHSTPLLPETESPARPQAVGAAACCLSARLPGGCISRSPTGRW